MYGTPMFHPIPARPLPAAVEYVSARLGCAAPRPAGIGMGSESAPLPVDRSAVNPSPAPPTVPGPDGSAIVCPPTVPPPSAPPEPPSSAADIGENDEPP